MRASTTILGLATLLALCGAIVVQVLYVSVWITTCAWVLFGALAATWVFLNRRRFVDFLTKKSTRYGANMALVLFLVLGILVFLNVLAKQHPWRKDLTRSGANTLSEQSQKILGSLTQPVTAYLFAGLQEKDKTEDILKRYSYNSKLFRYEFVDVDRNPTRAAAMGVKRKNTVIFTLGDGPKKMAVDQPTEETLTNGLIKLLRSNQVAVYFTTGHEEHPLQAGEDPLSYSQLRGELEKQGYSVKEVNLLSEGKIPADAAVLIVGGPHKAFFPKELDILSAWIKEGGHAILAVDLDIAESGLAKGSKQLAELVKPYGISVMNEMLVDPTSKMANVEPQVLLGFADSKDHAIVKDFPHATMAANFLFPLTTYLTRAEPAPYNVTPLASTTMNAWAESDWASLKQGRASYDVGKDHKGKMDLAYAVEAKVAAGAKPIPRSPKLVVFADALFATNNLIDKVGNKDLILNSVAWLADEENFISIRPREDQDGVRQYNNNVLNLVLVFTVFLLPLLLIGLGTWVWWKRSKL